MQDRKPEDRDKSVGQSRLSALPWQGGCQCGAVRYELRERPLTLYACHCTECRRQSASAFGMSLRVLKRSVTVQGNTSQWRRKTASGGDLIAHFCPQCGVRLFHERDSYASDPGGARMNIKGGTLDPGFLPAPVGHIWTDSALDWMVLPDNKLCYAGQPQDYEALIAAFAARYGQEE